MKPSATVQLPIAAFSLIIERLSDDALVPWVRSFSEALAFTDPTKNEFAASLLKEVETYRAEDAKRKKAQYGNKAQEQRPAVTEAGSGNAPGGPMDAFFSSVPATFDGAAGSPGGTPPQQPPAGKPRRPSPDMLRGYTIPEMGEVWDFVHEVGIPESIASEWFEWMDGQRKWPPLKKGWKVALRGFAKKKEEE